MSEQIYVASRTSRAEQWRLLRSRGVPIISSWIDEAGEGETGDFSELWRRIQREIDQSCGLLFYANTQDAPWKGALVEVGMALALGKPVAIVVDGELEGRTMRPVGSWILDSRVTHYPSLAQAINGLLERARENSATQPSTAAYATAPSQEGVGQGAVASAEPTGAVEEPKWVKHMRIATLDKLVPHESEYLAYVDALLAANAELRARIEAMENLLESRAYPEPPHYVIHHQDYYDGCTALRNALYDALKGAK